MNQKVVRLRGIYFKGTYINQYYHTATDRLVDESTSDELTLSMPLNLRDDFENGNVITVHGILDRTLTNKGLIQIVLKVTEVEKLKDLAVSENEIKRTELRRIKSEKGFKNVDSILKTSCSQDYIHKKKTGDEPIIMDIATCLYHLYSVEEAFIFIIQYFPNTIFATTFSYN